MGTKARPAALVTDALPAEPVELEQFVSAFESITDGLIVTDTSGRFVRCNAGAERLLERRLTGYSGPWHALADFSLADTGTPPDEAHDPVRLALDGAREAREFEFVV